MEEELELGVNLENFSKILEELDSIELELLTETEVEKEFGFVFSKGGGSRPRIEIDK